MIRDPSDGSVRDNPDTAAQQAFARSQAESNLQGNLTSSIDTGIRQPVRTDAMQRLDKSREWLRDYHAKKEREHARGSNDTEQQADGDSGNDQGQAERGLRADG
jgi:hypothetical protein